MSGEHSILSNYSRYTLLVLTLAGRDIKVRYRRTFLGVAWALIDPLFYMGVFSVLRSFLGISTGNIPYPVFLMSGVAPWTLFLGIVNACPTSIQSSAPLLKKMPFPREIFLLVATTTSVFDFLMSFLVLIGLVLLYQLPLTWYLLWIVPLIGMLLLLGLGFGMMVAAVGVFRHDFLKVSAYLFQFLFYISPTFYPVDLVPEAYRNLYALNPLVGLLTGFRNVLGAGQPPDMGLLATALPTVLIVYFAGWRIFRDKSKYFADVL